MIGFNYQEVLNAYVFSKEYEEILEFIYLGEIRKAEELYQHCASANVFDTLGCLYFILLQFALKTIRKSLDIHSSLIEKYEPLFNSTQNSILKIAFVTEKINHGLFEDAIEILKDVERTTFEPKIRGWIFHKFGIIYGLMGNYAEATVALLEAKNRYADYLGIIRMIQINLNLGSVYALTHSFKKAEESYLIAYGRSLLLKESTRLLTKCFNSLCWLYFETNEYDKVKELLLSKPDILLENKNTYFVLSWSYYKLGMKNEAVHYAKEGQIKFNDNEYACTVYKYIEHSAMDKKTGQEALLKKAITMKDYEHTQMIDELFTHELMDLYERRGNYEKAYKTAKKLLNR